MLIIYILKRETNLVDEDRRVQTGLGNKGNYRLTAPDKKHRRPIPQGESITVSIPKKHIFARAREVGMDIAEFILNYELEVSELIPRGGSILESYTVFRFVRRKGR